MATGEGCEFWQRAGRELKSGDLRWEDGLWDGEVEGPLVMVEEEDIYFWDEGELEDVELDGQVVPFVLCGIAEEDGGNAEGAVERQRWSRKDTEGVDRQI